MTDMARRDILQAEAMERPRPLLLPLIEKCIHLLFAFSLFLLALYLLGNFQSFLDRTQTLILSVLEWTTIIGGILCLYRLGYQLISWVWLKRFKISRLIAYVFILAINAGILITLKLLTAWFRV